MTLIPGTPYEQPVYLARNQAVDGDGNVGIIDISMCNAAIQPPVILGTLGGGAMTVTVLGSHDLIDWFDHSGGGFTSDFARSVVQGVRFWKVTVSNWAGGALTASVGAVSNMDGRVVTPMLYTRTSVVTGA